MGSCLPLTSPSALPHLHSHSLASNAALAPPTQRLLGHTRTGAIIVSSQSGGTSDSVVQPKLEVEGGPDTQVPKSSMLENKEKSLQSSMEEFVKDMEKRWGQVQDKALKQPFPGTSRKPGW